MRHRRAIRFRPDRSRELEVQAWCARRASPAAAQLSRRRPAGLTLTPPQAAETQDVSSRPSDGVMECATQEAQQTNAHPVHLRTLRPDALRRSDRLILRGKWPPPVSYTHLRAHETRH